MNYRVGCSGVGGTGSASVGVSVGSVPFVSGTGGYKYRNTTPYLFQAISLKQYPEKIIGA